MAALLCRSWGLCPLSGGDLYWAGSSTCILLICFPDTLESADGALCCSTRPAPWFSVLFHVGCVPGGRKQPAVASFCCFFILPPSGPLHPPSFFLSIFFFCVDPCTVTSLLAAYDHFFPGLHGSLLLAFVTRLVRCWWFQSYLGSSTNLLLFLFFLLFYHFYIYLHVYTLFGPPPRSSLQSWFQAEQVLASFFFF
jgi:hypothetical protein